jgi:hypothetical protein
MTNLDIQNYSYLLKHFHKKINFLSGIMAQEDFVASNFEKAWIAVYFIPLIRNWKKSFENVLKKLFSVKI